MRLKPTNSCNIIFLLITLPFVINAQRRCFQCRSRTELGDCKDPFTLNATTAAADPDNGVRTIPCASGWCGKIVEGLGRYKVDDYGVATERFCLQRSPSDGEGRCAETQWHHRKVLMCYCRGDLCNSALKSHTANSIVLVLPGIYLLTKHISSLT